MDQAVPYLAVVLILSGHCGLLWYLLGYRLNLRGIRKTSIHPFILKIIMGKYHQKINKGKRHANTHEGEGLADLDEKFVESYRKRLGICLLSGWIWCLFLIGLDYTGYNILLR